LSNELFLKDLLNKPKISIANKLLIILSTNSNKPKSVKEISNLIQNYGVKNISSSKISTYLHRSNGKAIKTPSGWELTITGIDYVLKNFNVEINFPEKSKEIQIAKSLRAHLIKIKNPETKSFVEESVRCLENKLFRSAVVLSWVGGMAVLYDYVINHKLSDFNAELIRRDPKIKPIKISDDFRSLKESVCLDILESISIIGGDVKKELKKCLDLRNSCGHPNSLKIGEHRVSAHIEILILNVFSIYC
jgi:hypothetical protein